MENSLPLIVSVCVVMLVGGLLQGFLGWGMALFCVPLLTFLLPVRMAVPLSCLCGCFITAAMVLRMIGHVQWKAGASLLIGSMPGVLLGATVLKKIPAPFLLGAIGLILIVSTVRSLLERASVSNKPTWSVVTAGSGFISGMLGASVGLPGPPLIAYVHAQPWTTHQIKGTINFVFVVQATLSASIYLVNGLLTREVWHWYAFALPSLFAGMMGGMKLYDRVHKSEFDLSKFFQIVLILLGVSLFVRALLLLFR